MPSIPPSGTPDNNTGLGSSQPQSGGLQTPHDTSPQAASPDHAATQATFNEAGVRSAQANWLDGLNSLLYDPGTGYLNQQGAAAVGGYDPVQQAIGKLYQQAQDSLADDHQRAIFTQATAPIINAAQARIQQHAQAQSQVYDADASRARARAARDLAVNAWNPAPGADNSNYRQGAAILHNELENQFRHTWGDPASAGNQTLWDHFLQHGPNGDDGIASLSTGVVNRLLANDQPGDAQTFLDQTRHTLPAPTADKLQQFVTAGLDQRAGMTAAVQAQATGNDPATQQQKLDTLHNDGHISDQAHTIATHKIQADQAAQAAAQQQNDIQTLHKVWALKNANPNAAITDLGSADYAYLKSRGLDANALAILQSHPATDDPALYNQLHSMASQDPVTFGKQNLLAQSGKLSRAHMQTLLNLQDAVNKQEPQAIQAGKRIAMTVNAVMGDVRSAIPRDGSANPAADNHATQDQADTLEAGLRDHLIATQQNDPKLTLDDLYGAGASYLKDAYLYGLDGDGSGVPTDAEQARNRALFGPFDSSASSVGSEGDQAHSSTAAGSDKSAAVTMKQGGAVGTGVFSEEGRLGVDIDKDIIPDRFKTLEHGNLTHVNAIVLHRTDTRTAESVLNSYHAGQRTGAHFLIDTDGTIYQTADLTKLTYHVGYVRRRCEADDSCPAEDDERLDAIQKSVKDIHDKKKRNERRLLLETQMEYQHKDYPDRYPYNGDSVGIEIAGKYNPQTKQFTAPTQAQIDSVHKLVTALQRKFGLDDSDVYTHGQISYKMPAEGTGFGYN